MIIPSIRENKQGPAHQPDMHIHIHLCPHRHVMTYRKTPPFHNFRVGVSFAAKMLTLPYLCSRASLCRGPQKAQCCAWSMGYRIPSNKQSSHSWELHGIMIRFIHWMWMEYPQINIDLEHDQSLVETSQPLSVRVYVGVSINDHKWYPKMDS